MRKLIILLFASALIFGCSQEAEEKTGEIVEEAATDNGMNVPKLEPLPDWDSLPPIVEEIVEEAATDNGMNVPKLEPLPDWDSLPPIVEEMASEDGTTMMEKAEEKTEETVDIAKDKVGEMMKKE